MKEIDARGLACPAPVLQTKAALQSQKLAEVKVIVDNEGARQNVKRFLESEGFETAVQKDGNDLVVIGKCSATLQPHPQKVPEADTELKKIVIMCATDRIGFGDDELGLKLMVNFIGTLKEMGSDLWRLVLVNNGVKLTIDESPVLQDLKRLEEDGLTILVCGTCLEHFDLFGKKKVGETTNMLDIVTAMQLADNVITI